MSKFSPGTTCGATTIVTAAATEVEEEVEKTEEEVHSPHLHTLESLCLSLWTPLQGIACLELLHDRYSMMMAQNCMPD